MLKFYKKFFALYVLLVFQNVLTLSVNLADNLMLGAYSEQALSGVTAVNQVQFVFQQLLNAIGDGLVILGTQYWGKRNIKAVKKISAAAVRYAVCIALLLFVITGLFPEKIVGIFTTEQMIIKEGASYLNIVKWSYLFFALTMVSLALLRTVEVVRPAFILSICVLVINCGINYILIYGRFGFPQMGVRGAAIGTVTARIVECILALWFLFKREKWLEMKRTDLIKIDHQLHKDYLKLMFPLLCIQGMWGVNTALQTVILGHMTPRAIAANSVASNLFLLVKSTAVGAALAGAIIIGKAVGEGNMNRVRDYAKRMQLLFVLIGIVAGTLLYFLRIPILSFYDLSPETKELANTFLIILSVVCVGMSYQMPTNDGIIKGGGNPMFVMKLNILSIWIIVIPISFIAAFVMKASPAVVVCCLNADQIFKCIPAYIMANHGKWMRELTRK
ncbi:MAG: MATE family efflux transporter [Lachnospiraceae bacterium]